MYNNFEINTAEDLVKGFAIAIRDKQLSISEVHDFIMDCTDGDKRMTQVAVEKTLIHLECLNLAAPAA